MVQRSPGLMTTVRMYSNRTTNTEFVIGEGKRSHHLANGCTLIYRTGEEYRDVFPVWNWNKIPGTTAEQINFTIQTNPQAKTGADFVGCVSDGGVYGACVQDLQRGSLTAKKFWLTFEDAMVALGVGISCGSDKSIVTTINQALLRDMPTRTGNTIWHDGVSYIVLDEQVPQMTAGPQSGRWSDIGTGSDEPLTSDVMTLWLDHGVKPKNASYAYFVLLDAEEASNIKVLANTPDLQAALNTKLNLLAAAFWKVGTLDAGDLKIEVDQPCMVLARNQQITVSNPRNQPLVVNLKVNGIALTFNLPAGAMAGSSITQELPLSDVL
jgi:chondroitin AC lyase